MKCRSCREKNPSTIKLKCQVTHLGILCRLVNTGKGSASHYTQPLDYWPYKVQNSTIATDSFVKRNLASKYLFSSVVPKGERLQCSACSKCHQCDANSKCAHLLLSRGVKEDNDYCLPQTDWQSAPPAPAPAGS